MKQKILFLTVFFCAVLDSTAQKRLTKQEIIDEWCSSKQKRDDKKDSINISFNPEVNKKIIQLLDSLEQRNIDSFLIYSKAYPGAYSLNKPCFTTSYSEYIYIIWRAKGELNFKTIAGDCEKNTILLKSSKIFNYLSANKEAIFNTCIMPVIFSAHRVKNKSITFSMSIINHEPNYVLGCKIGKNYNEFNFAESFLENKKSLFAKYNLSLKSIHLWNLLEAEIGKFDKF